MHEAGLPLKLYVWEGTRNYWDSALLEPSKIVTWIIIYKNDVIYKSFLNTGKLNNYIKVYASDDTIIYRLTKNKN